MTLFNQSTVDDRTVDDQLSDLGVPVERPHPAKNLERVKFYTPGYRLGGGMHKSVTVGKSCLYFSGYFKTACEGAMRLRIGVGDYDGKRVLIIKPDPFGIAITYAKSGYARLGSKNIVGWLIEQGLSLGRYDIRRAKGGFIGVPQVEGDK